MASNTFVGSHIVRREDWRFLRGSGTYVDDVVRPGTLWAAIVRSPVAHGRLKRLDTAAALALDGVARIITAADIGAPVPVIGLRAEHSMPSLDRFLQPVIAGAEVRYAGEPVAVVLADSAALAEDGAARVTLDIDTLPAVTDRYAAPAERRDGAARSRPRATPMLPSPRLPIAGARRSTCSATPR